MSELPDRLDCGSSSCKNRRRPYDGARINGPCRCYLLYHDALEDIQTLRREVADLQAIIGDLRQDTSAYQMGLLDGEQKALTENTIVTEEGDGTDRLCRAVYGREPRARDYIGGSGARMLHDAADLILRLRLGLETVAAMGPWGRQGEAV